MVSGFLLIVVEESFIYSCYRILLCFFHFQVTWGENFTNANI